MSMHIQGRVQSVQRDTHKHTVMLHKHDLHVRRPSLLPAGRLLLMCADAAQHEEADMLHAVAGLAPVHDPRIFGSMSSPAPQTGCPPTFSWPRPGADSTASTILSNMPANSASDSMRSEQKAVLSMEAAGPLWMPLTPSTYPMSTVCDVAMHMMLADSMTRASHTMHVASFFSMPSSFSCYLMH